MKRWKTQELTRACLFSALLALLMGCNNDGGDTTSTPVTDGTFASNEDKSKIVDDTKVPDKPVVGIVTVVPDTEPKPVVSNPSPWEQTTITQGEVKTYVEPAKRFIEVAPDTAKGEAFQVSSKLDYNLGSLVARQSTDLVEFKEDGVLFITPINGWARIPVKPLDGLETKGKFPVIIFLHGQHEAKDPSYQGYDYLARELAKDGYVVLSIDANVINADRNENQSSLARAQLVLGTLDRLRQINENGQIDKAGNPGKLNILRDKLDFSRVGIMGHSRGGQGISNTIIFNETRRGVTEAEFKAALKSNASRFKSAYPDLWAAVSGSKLDEDKFKAAIETYGVYYAAGSGNQQMPPPYDFKGAFLLAQTDFGGNRGLGDVPIATLLPSCDGDMRNLQGSSTYDRNRFGRPKDAAPRYQIMVNGANHNDYNEIWTSDDFSRRRGPDYCLKTNPDSIRLSVLDQQRTGRFIINSFMRYHVGGEMKFASWWNGMAQLPDDACPSGKGPCDERIVLTTQKPANRRLLIQNFEWADSLRRNLVGGTVLFSGFDASARCNMPSAADTGGTCLPKRLPGFEYFNWDGGKGLLSIADQAQLAWSKPNASIVSDLKDLSARDYDSLTFRIAVVRPMGQEVLVTLTDTAGKSATVTASDFTNALYNAPRRKTYPVKTVQVADASIGLQIPPKESRPWLI